MASCSRMLSVSGTARIAHELPITVAETCSDVVDQYACCRSTTAHGKPRGTLLLFYAAHHHGCLYTSGCRLALVILFCLALFFQAAAQSPPPPQSSGSPYPGWDRQLINSSHYVYYPINEENVVKDLFIRWSAPHYIEWPPISSSNSFPCISEAWPGIVCSSSSFEDTYNNNQTSRVVTIAFLDVSNSGIQDLLPSAIGNLSNLIILNLQGNNFTGSIPTIYGNLKRLIQLDLSDNELTGPIPPELGNLTFLESLYLYGNQLNGKIPISSNNATYGLNNLTELVSLNLSINNMDGSIDIDLIFNTTSPFELGILDLSHNNFSNISKFSSFSTSFHQLMINNNSIFGSIDLSSINVSCTYEVDFSGNNIINVSYNPNLVSSQVSIMLENNPCCQSWTTTKVSSPNAADIYYFCNANYTPPKKFSKKDVQPRMYAYKDLQKATNNFHDNMKLGQGAFGAVYKGVLDGSEIAVKLLLPEVQQGMEEFSNEIVLVTSMRHKNLVKLKGCCFGDREQ